jgi:AraC-like DNA-binding protein
MSREIAFNAAMRHPLPATAGEFIPFPCASAWVRAAALCHINLPPMLEQAGLCIDAQGTQHIRRDGLLDMMMRCVGQAAPTHHFPLVLGECYGFDTLPAIETFLATSPTVREALPVLNWTSRMLPDLDMQLIETGAEAAILIELERRDGDPPKAAGYFAECTVASLHKFSRMLLSGRSLATRIEFEHDPGPLRTQCEMQFGVPVRVRQARNAAVFPRALLDMRLPGALPTLHRQLQGVIEQSLPAPQFTTLADRIERLFRQQPRWMGQGIQNVAEHLGLHPRTLQRRLKDEGQVYGDIQARCRYEHAVTQLKVGQVDIDTLSETLGFTDRNSFTRAFKQWTGMAPRDFRRLHRCMASEAGGDAAVKQVAAVALPG